PGGRVDDLGRGQGNDDRRAAEARPLVRARPARDRHFRAAPEVRAAVAEGAEGRLARARGRLGARDARGVGERGRSGRTLIFFGNSPPPWPPVRLAAAGSHIL